MGASARPRRASGSTRTHGTTLAAARSGGSRVGKRVGIVGRRRRGGMVLGARTVASSLMAATLCVGRGLASIGALPPRLVAGISRSLGRRLQHHRASKQEGLDALRTVQGADGAWIVVGLGNPGPRYDGTRHNVGFRVLDAIAAAEGIPLNQVYKKRKSRFGVGAIGGTPVVLLKPLTFMNLSGEAVAAVSTLTHVPPSRVLVIYDDLDLPTAQVKLKPKGGHGGHNGMRNIIDHFNGKRDFPRLKVGIGRPDPLGGPTVVEYVLGGFDPGDESAAVDAAVDRAATIVSGIMRDGFEKALSTANKS